MTTIAQVVSLIQLSSFPFIFVNDLTSARLTATSLIANLDAKQNIQTVRIDAIVCFTPRLIFDTVINGFTHWEPSWDDGCMNWSPDDQQLNKRYNDSLDAFLHGLKDMQSHLSKKNQIPPRMVLVVEYPERLKEGMPETLVPLTRLRELSNLDVTVVFVSAQRWEDIKPPLGAALDPYFVDMGIPTKEGEYAILLPLHRLTMFPAVMKQISSSFTDHLWSMPSSSSSPNPYHPVFQPLYVQYLSFVYDICHTFTDDPSEIGYIAAARWPGFVKPIIDGYKLRSEEAGPDEAIELEVPTTEFIMRLTRHFKPSLSAALEKLYPRHTNAADWAAANEPNESVLDQILGLPPSPTKSHHATDDEGMEEDELPQIQSSPTRPRSERIRSLHSASQPQTDYFLPLFSFNPNESSSSTPSSVALANTLPRISRFILISAFIASMNPAKSDLRMFGRGLDGKKRKRRVIRTKKQTKPTSGPAKIPQRYLGPALFPLDRLIAILGALLEENDAPDSEDMPDEFTIPGEYTDMEVRRVGIYASITQLTNLRLLVRTSPPERLDGPPMYKTGPGVASSYEDVSIIAKGLGITLSDLIWEREN
ncbi:hypothetical protein K435DRAFT_818207 [Dendrothele bispora CBS 962.96]|uniref:Origin recognition complex subunit 5 n=1 Tax=Dendrothele bispora (strain CBS 962.96) TaxID=1314807 RepID=A0A4S8ME34_DENBC|nr:hypothetical protein K435DRAFT_818207 [Dendrothele bispora CBS 962.96]